MKLTNDHGTPTRRAVLAGLGIGALGLAGAGSALSISWAGTGTRKSAGWWNALYPSLRHGGVAQWSQLVGEWFHFGQDGGGALYRITAVTALPSPGVRPADVARSQAFSVTFQNNLVRQAVEGNRTIEMTHPSHAAFPIFVGPGVRVGPRSLLTAIFN